jgi:hypothetical protein
MLVAAMGMGAASMEPVSTTGAWAKTLGIIKDWPLWLLVAVAVSLTVFVAVPDFRHLVVSPAANSVVFYGVIVAWIFVAARGAKPAFEAARWYQCF